MKPSREVEHVSESVRIELISEELAEEELRHVPDLAVVESVNVRDRIQSRNHAILRQALSLSFRRARSWRLWSET